MTQTCFSLRGSEAFVLYRLYKLHGKIVYIINNEEDIDIICDQLKFIDSTLSISILNSWDCDIPDIVSPSINITGSIIKSLYDIERSVTDIAIISYKACIRYYFPINTIDNEKIILSVKDNIDRDILVRKLLSLGYFTSTIAAEIGSFSFKGSIFDIVTIDKSIRIDLDADVIDSIKGFDIHSQMTNDMVYESITVLPISEIILDRKKYFLSNKNKIDLRIYEAVSQDIRADGIEFYLNYFYKNKSTLLDYINNYKIIADYEVESKIKSLHGDKDHNILLNEDENDKIYDNIYIQISNFSEGSDIDNDELFCNVNLKKTSSKQSIIKTIKSFMQDNIPIIISSYKEKNFCYLKGIFDSNDIKYKIVNNDFLYGNNISIGLYITRTIFNKSIKNNKFYIISDNDILDIKSYVSSNKSTDANILSEAINFEANDFVVHIDYGIAKFLGIFVSEINNVKYDMIKLLYQNEDIVYIPIRDIDMISYYAPSISKVELDRLGSNLWSKRKEKISKKIYEIAQELIDTAAARDLVKSKGMTIDFEEYKNFINQFPFIETNDQLNAINNIENSLCSNELSNHLICGDVGVGKTEVAMRAAFISYINGYQVAFLCPTTILATQHFNSFKERFKNFPTNIALLSSSVSRKDQLKIKQRIKDDEIDIIIGTHAILSKTIEFNSLNLLIIDEEQQFGVKQKELIKQRNKDVNVIYLSATPIPRTLQMSLSDIQKISFISEKHIGKKSVKRYVMTHDEEMIVKIIIKEFDRNGKVFYICPKIKDFQKIQFKILKNIPNCNFNIAHGQMQRDELERIMKLFTDGNFNLLLTTSIVESGLDIKDANTIIIHDSHLFGLSQLYQLQGRVGRSDIQGYCYYTIPKNCDIKDKIKERLNILDSSFGEVNGFNIALYDMESRGFGNLVGKEQSGHIKEIGTELYYSLLNDAISKLKNSNTANEINTIIKVDFSINIPEDYISDQSIRINLYKKINRLSSIEEVEQFSENIHNRFGKFPDSVNYLINISILRIIASQSNILEISLSLKYVIFKIHIDLIFKIQDIFSYLTSNNYDFSFDIENKEIKIKFNYSNLSVTIKSIKNIIENINK